MAAANYHKLNFINQILVHLHVNKTNFHMKGFALGLALKQRRKATRKSSIMIVILSFSEQQLFKERRFL